MNLTSIETGTLVDKAVVELHSHDILIFLISLVIGVIYFTLEFKNKRLSDLTLEISKKLKSAEYIKTPYDNLNAPDLEKIINKISNNFRIVITIYGVLLAFVVSDKISSSLSNWGFLIWAGWIIAIIIRASMHLYELSDIIERGWQLTYIRKTVFASNQFFKHSLIFFAIGIALLPSFFWVNTPTLEEIKNLPWNMSFSIFSGAFAILLITLVFYLLLWIFSAQFEGGKLNLFFYSLLLIGTSALDAASNNSPLTPVLVSIVGQKFFIPSAFYLPLSFSGPAIIGATVMRIGRMIFYYFKYLRK